VTHNIAQTHAGNSISAHRRV